MTKQNLVALTEDIDYRLRQSSQKETDLNLTSVEIENLKKLLQFVQYDETQDAVRIEIGKCKILCRSDGSLMIEGEEVTTCSQGKLQMNAAIIELN